MRKLLLGLLALLIFIICMGSLCPDTDNTPPIESTLPPVPRHISPDSASAVVGPDVLLVWHSVVDPDGDDVRYSVSYRITDGTSFQHNYVETTHIITDLSLDDTVTWRIEALDRWGFWIDGTNWFFTVTGMSGTPYSPNPDSGAVNVGINTNPSWDYMGSSGEVDHCDIYFGTNHDPGLHTVDFNGTTFDPGTLEYQTEHFWKIVAFISSTDSITGPTWSFTTIDENLEIPTNPNPPDQAQGVNISTNLNWDYTGTPGDVVYCDVYFGTSPTPPLAVPQYENTTYDPPGDLDYSTTYYWQIIAFTSPTDFQGGPVWSFTTESSGGGGVYAQFKFTADILDEYFSWDEIRARFDSSYAPNGPIDTLQADSVTVNGTVMNWNSYSGFYSYFEDPSMHWLVDGGQYTFQVFGNDYVPNLTLETTWLECVPMISYPTSADTIYNAGFTTSWEGICAGDVILTFVIGGSDTSDVWIETANDGEYSFTGDDLAPLGGYQGVITEVIMSYDQYLIDEPGFMQASEVIMRSTHSVTTIIE